MNENDSENKVLRFIPALLPLQELAINTIVKNIGAYRDLITKKIAPPMRKILFDEAMKRKKEIGEEQIWAALPYLDQHKATESFSTKEFASIFRLKRKSGGFSEACVSMEEFLQYLVDFVPNLKKLEIEDPRRAYPYSERKMFIEIQLQPAATDLLLKMENLTEVSIYGVYIKFTEFVRLCRESRNLQSIQANNIFFNMEPTNSMKNILETFASKFDNRRYFELCFPRYFAIFLRKTIYATPHREAQVTLSNDFFDLIPFGLTQLDISADKTIDTQSERNRLLRNLRRVGGTLKTLIIGDFRPELNITFKHIFEHCHDLETLQIRNSYVSLDDPIASFGQLKSFAWTEQIGGEVEGYSTLHLDRIFSAPHLQDIFIRTNLILDLGDKEALLDRIRNRRIFTKLNKMQIWSYVPRDYPRSNEEELNELADGLRSLDCNVRVIIEDRPLSSGRHPTILWFFRHPQAI